MALPKPAQPSKDARELEAAYPTAHQEKEALSNRLSHRHHLESQLPQAPRRKMSAGRRLLLGLVLCLAASLAVVSALPAHTWNRIPCPHHRQDLSRADAGAGAAPESVADVNGEGDAAAGGKCGDEAMFSCLLDAVSPEVLHELLHRYFPTRFKDGVYPSDQSAIEAVHREDPPLASSLARIAKRQNATTSDPTTSNPPGPTGPTLTDTTTTGGRPTTSDPTGPSSPSTTPSSSPTAGPSTQNTATTNTTPGQTRPTPTPTPTSRSLRPVTNTFTSTGSNGDVTIVTATTYVEADPVETSTTQPEGSLQTNAAVPPRSRNVVIEALAGAVMGGLILL